MNMVYFSGSQPKIVCFLKDSSLTVFMKKKHTDLFSFLHFAQIFAQFLLSNTSDCKKGTKWKNKQLEVKYTMLTLITQLIYH